ncbi:cation transporter [Sporolactobacillus shoreicorticis]|uniref:Cation transporter n=1 Tax=Sporolactobacillus shoreicorticis TaxID=1923877 RepID=A0ABW5S3G0_9BACL|nr:cation transporter [Sporolactobacillus shoreicorticis]MCO7126528.1 cation transporter [Sporolactobacillus shoreicorticis]
MKESGKKADYLMNHVHGDGDYLDLCGEVDGGKLQNKDAAKSVFISVAVLLITAIFQTYVAVIAKSPALFALTIHGYCDFALCIPLWIASALNCKKLTSASSFSYHRIKKVVKLLILLAILMGIFVAGYESLLELVNGTQPMYLEMTAIAVLLGFVSNQSVAFYMIQMGIKWGKSDAITYGRHVRLNRWTSLTVFVGVIGSWLGFSAFVSIAGLAAALVIFYVIKDSLKQTFMHLFNRP